MTPGSPSTLGLLTACIFQDLQVIPLPSLTLLIFFSHCFCLYKHTQKIIFSKQNFFYLVWQSICYLTIVTLATKFAERKKEADYFCLLTFVSVSLQKILSHVQILMVKLNETFQVLFNLFAIF